MISPPDCNPAARHGNAGSLPQEERTAVIAVESGNDGGCLGLPSFRGASETRTRTLEIPRCATAHLRSGPSDHPGMTPARARKSRAAGHVDSSLNLLATRS